MAWFRRRNKATPSEAEILAEEVFNDYLAASNEPPSNRPKFWLDHGYENGDRVECMVCGTPLVVKIMEYSRSIISTAEVHAGRPLICGDCGRLFCVECSLRRHPNRPSCDRCRRIGGVTSLMRR